MVVRSTEEGNVVHQQRIGNTRIKICDDYCRHLTKEDVDATLRRIADRVYEQLVAQMATELENDTEE